MSRNFPLSVRVFKPNPPNKYAFSFPSEVREEEKRGEGEEGRGNGEEERDNVWESVCGVRENEGLYASRSSENGPDALGDGEIENGDGDGEEERVSGSSEER
jgi:hypothetical protein